MTKRKQLMNIVWDKLWSQYGDDIDSELGDQFCKPLEVLPKEIKNGLIKLLHTKLKDEKYD